MLISTGNTEACKQCFPVRLKRSKSFYCFVSRIKSLDQGLCRSLVDDARCFPFIVCRIFTVTQHEDKFSFFTRCKRKVNLMRRDRIPAACNRIAAVFPAYCLRESIAVSCTQESIPAGVIILNRHIDRKETVMPSSFPVLCLVVDRASLHLNLTCTQIPLEIRRIIHSIPETEFHVRKQRDIFFHIRIIL